VFSGAPLPSLASSVLTLPLGVSDPVNAVGVTVSEFPVGFAAALEEPPFALGLGDGAALLPPGVAPATVESNGVSAAARLLDESSEEQPSKSTSAALAIRA
jgi:hypothetical protein